MDTDAYHTFLRDVADIEKFQDFVKDNYDYPDDDLAKQRFNPLLHLDDKEFIKKYRFTKESMQKIITLIVDDLDVDYSQIMGGVGRRPQVPVEIQVMAALRFWGRTEHPFMTAYTHGVSSPTLYRISKRVSGALASKASFHIRMPATLSEKEAATHAFQFAKMPSVIGVVDHHSVRFRKQTEPQTIGSKQKFKEEQIHIQLISDAFCKIRDIDCKLRPLENIDGNDVNETFSQSRIKERFEQNEFRGRILLGRERLTCKSYLLTPVELPVSHKEKAYNRAHAATLAPAEECLNLWKKRFCILESEICSTYNTAKNTIVALAVLHNLAIDWDDQTSDRSTQVNTKAIMNTHHLLAKGLDMDARAEFIKNHF